MEVHNIGKTEMEILEYLFTHKDQYALQIKEALDKPHLSYLSKPIKSLLKKNYIKITGEYRPPDKGRPAKKYSLTSDGLRLIMLSIDGPIGTGLFLYRDIDSEFSDLCYVLETLAVIGYNDPDSFIKELLYITQPLVSRISTGDVKSMMLLPFFLPNKHA